MLPAKLHKPKSEYTCGHRARKIPAPKECQRCSNSAERIRHYQFQRYIAVMQNLDQQEAYSSKGGGVEGALKEILSLLHHLFDELKLSPFDVPRVGTLKEE
jgi:hypothetical protein